jgi:hypothetical protein
MSGGGGSSGSVDNTAIGHGGGLPGGNNIAGTPAVDGTPTSGGGGFLGGLAPLASQALNNTSTAGGTGSYSPQQIQSAIDTSRQQGFSNQDILTGLGRYGVNSGPQQNAVMAQTSGARPSSSDPQFYQPVYQGQYQNYATTNPLGVSQYGTQQTPQSMVDSAYAGIGRYGSGSGVNQVDQAGRQYWNNQLSSGAVAPQDFNRSFNSAVQQYQTQNPNSALTQYTQNQPGYSGGYSGYAAPQQAFTANNPFNAYTGSAYSPQQVRNAIGTSQQQGFSSQDIATGLGRNGVYLSPQQTQMYNPYTPPVVNQSGYIPLSDWRSALPPLPAQTDANTPRESFGQIITGNTVNSVTQGLPQQQPQQQYNPLQSMGLPNPFNPGGQQQQQMYNPFSYGGQQSYQQPQQQYNPYNYQPQQQSSPYQQYQPQQPYDQGFVAPQQPVIPTSSGPSQAIVGRSSQGRGTPNVMRRAEGGIIDLMDKT